MNARNHLSVLFMTLKILLFSEVTEKDFELAKCIHLSLVVLQYYFSNKNDKIYAWIKIL